MKHIKSALIGATILLITGCASKTTIPIKVQSDPLGAHVIYQIQSVNNNASTGDWIYLGNTPVEARKVFSNNQLKKGTFVIRVIKEGYLNQDKAWSVKEMKHDTKDCKEEQILRQLTTTRFPKRAPTSLIFFVNALVSTP